MGLELDYRKYFDSPFSWIGDGRLFVAANYTWSDSEVQVDDGYLAYTLACNGLPQAAPNLVADGSLRPGQSAHLAHVQFAIEHPTPGRHAILRVDYPREPPNAPGTCHLATTTGI